MFKVFLLGMIFFSLPAASKTLTFEGLKSFSNKMNKQFMGAKIDEITTIKNVNYILENSIVGAIITFNISLPKTLFDINEMKEFDTKMGEAFCNDIQVFLENGNVDKIEINTSYIFSDYETFTNKVKCNY
ncbi:MULTISPECIES: hypothetical protein [unclassified Colwellia]|uniref:hypothetical protein n=1 Tax=unclassified Colwellia TaxID=196834 RepID=UPI0015F43DCD|nr:MULTISPECIES: hypothetical protein [unclassified Colwellia]MBA6379685.1 hypothetical protein [Colwellia sp. BRX10-7]MBA6388500.1 hypothetical protein [Colwellia sp. BRX10-2]MBA6402986.1 hypothetical protein [Colwellia sp. BRX10-5]MBA6406303.1 hypothetical protein [Colwellia sp. BRX10-1]